MEFKLNAVIHRGRDYPKFLSSFQHKRADYIEQELRSFDSELLQALLLQLQKNGRTLDKITGMAV